MEFSKISTLLPVNLRTFINSVKFLGLILFISTLPLVMLDAIAKDPASILSETTEWETWFNCFTPLIIKLSVPIPFISAPALFKQFAKSVTSGSFAAL